MACHAYSCCLSGSQDLVVRIQSCRLVVNSYLSAVDKGCLSGDQYLVTGINNIRLISCSKLI